MNEYPMRPSDPDDNEFLSHLGDIGTEDAAGLQKAQGHYGNSWKLRGGVGAFMMLARKWDRIEKRLAEQPLVPQPFIPSEHPDSCGGTQPAAQPGDRFDIFHHLMADDRPEGLIDDIRDLRRYLMLVEAEARAMHVPAACSQHRDNPQGATT